MSARPCSVPGCERQQLAKGFCVTHYARHRRGKPLEPAIRIHERGANTGQCRAPLCTRWAFERGLCATHYRRQWKGGRPEDLLGPVRGRRPDDPNRVLVTVGMSPELRERIRRIARQRQVSVSLLVTSTLAQHFTQHTPEDE